MALKDDRVEQCLRACGSEFQMWGPKQEIMSACRTGHTADTEKFAALPICQLKGHGFDLHSDLTVLICNVDLDAPSHRVLQL